MSKLGSVERPDLAALLQAWSDQIFANLNCHQLGTITSFDKDKQTAKVMLKMLRQVGDTAIEYPILVDVPVFIARGGGAFLWMPITAGDPCLVLFNDRDMDNWYATGATAVPNTERLHSLADGLALVGFSNLGQLLTPLDNGIAGMKYSGAQMILTNAGQAKLDGAGGATVNVNTKVSIANDTGTLKAALDALCLVLSLWVNTGGSTPNAATLTAIAAAQATIDDILA